MVLSQSDAAAALSDIHAAADQSRAYTHYRHASSHLLLWGTLWLVSGVVSDIAPQSAGSAWMVADTIGAIGSVMIGRSMARKDSDRVTAARRTSRVLTSMAAYVVFAVAAMVLMHPTSAAQATTFFALLIGALYVGVGVWIGIRYVIIGSAVAALSAAIYWLHLPHASAMISIVGGGSLLIGGFWMRRA